MLRIGPKDRKTGAWFGDQTRMEHTFVKTTNKMGTGGSRRALDAHRWSTHSTEWLPIERKRVRGRPRAGLRDELRIFRAEEGLT